MIRLSVEDTGLIQTRKADAIEVRIAARRLVAAQETIVSMTLRTGGDALLDQMGAELNERVENLDLALGAVPEVPGIVPADPKLLRLATAEVLWNPIATNHFQDGTVNAIYHTANGLSLSINEDIANAAALVLLRLFPNGKRFLAASVREQLTVIDTQWKLEADLKKALKKIHMLGEFEIVKLANDRISELLGMDDVTIAYGGNDPGDIRRTRIAGARDALIDTLIRYIAFCSVALNDSTNESITARQLIMEPLYPLFSTRTRTPALSGEIVTPEPAIPAVVEPKQ